MRPPGDQTTRRRVIPAPRRRGIIAKRTVKPAPRVTKPRITIKPKPSVTIKPPVTGTTPTPGLLDVRSRTDIQKAAEGEVDSELSGQITPLESQVGATQGRENAAQSELEKMFNELQPAVSDSMHLVSDNYDKTLQAEQAIFSAAGTRLNQVKQDAASEAQKMAQQVGGPVAVDKFTGAVDPSLGAFGAEQAGSLLHAMGLHQAGVEEQAAWAGKVFPLIRVQKEMGTRARYEEDIKGLQDKIAALKGTRTGLVNSRVNDLLGKEREYALQKAQQQLEKLKAQRDYQATLHTLRNDDARLSLAGYTAKTSRIGTLGKLKIDAAKLNQKERNDAAKLGLSRLEYARKLNQGQQSLDIQRGRLKVQQEGNAIQRAKALANPAGLKPITLTHKIEVPPQQLGAVITGKMKDAWYDKKTHKWYRYVKETTTTAEWARRHSGGAPVTDPKQMYQMLRNLGSPPSAARKATIKALGKDPTPGKKGK